jgi:LacI family transcriptional regulator, gluconate utilization system Gnt-I transcriptional repressor
VEAAICVSDLSAFGALAECQRRGWKVPERIALAGFGDFEISACCHPALTTVGVHCYDIGHKAGELLLRAIEGERNGNSIAAETVMTEFEVIPRAST